MKTKNSKTILFDTYEYKRVLVENSSIEIPTEPTFYDKFNHRVEVGLFPQITNHGGIEYISINIIEITDDNLFRCRLEVSPLEFSIILSRSNVTNKSKDDILRLEVIEVLRGASADKSDRNHFEEKYNEWIERSSAIIFAK